MLIGSQCRMARAALFWSVRELSKRSSVSTTTITRFENDQTVPIKATLIVLQRTFEDAGIEFTNGKAPGVRLHKR
jgi:transcriptional regulator with XRE-family HTH domain